MKSLSSPRLPLVALMLATTSLSRRPATTEGENTFDFPDEVTDINAVPERARGLYEQEGEKYKYKGVDGLRSAVSSTRAERDAANRRAKDAAAYAALGKTPEEIKQLLDAEEERKNNKLKEEGDWNALKQQMEENHANALGEKDNRIKKLEGALNNTLIENGLRTVLSDKEVEGNPLFLLPHMRGRVKLEETDDGYKTVVMRPDGSPMLNAQNQPAELKDLALEFKGNADFAPGFKGLQQSGGGGTGTGGEGGGQHRDGGTKKRSEMSNMEKVSFIQKHGKAEYEKLPE